METDRAPRLETVPTRMMALSCVQADGVLVAAPLFEMAALVGHSGKAMRDCLGRMMKEGLLTQLDGRGRSAIYQASESGTADLRVDLAWTAFAHRVDAGLEPWDRNWRLVSFEVAEPKRTARDALRNLLVELGASAMHSGLYVHAYDVSDFVGQLASRLDIADSVASFATPSITFGVAHNALDVVERLWSLDDLADRYRVLEKQLVTLVDGAASRDGSETASEMFSLIARTDAAMRDDPLLPLELLPEDWPGASARRAFLEAFRVTSEHSVLFNDSRMMRAYASEIDRALGETSAAFWSRWFPLLLDSYESRLPPAARK